MPHFRILAIVWTMATALFATAQAHLMGDAAQLLSLHYGSKATGTPPVVRWQPSPEVAARFENYESGPLETTVDTTFLVGGSELIVFFRTQVPRDPELMFCEACVDRIDVARMGFDDNDRPTKKEAFVPGLLMQGTLEGQPKPELVLINGWPAAVKLVSSEGFMENNTTTAHFFSFPELRPILQTVTQAFSETRGGPHGPQSSLTQREVRFIPEDSENTGLFQVEVITTGDSDEPKRTFTWSDSQHRFVPNAVATPAKKK